MKLCELDKNKICDHCNRCNMCSLDPNKVCDNCFRCLDTGEDYIKMPISELLDDDNSLIMTAGKEDGIIVSTLYGVKGKLNR